MSSKAQQSVEEKRKRLAELRARREARAAPGGGAASPRAGDGAARPLPATPKAQTAADILADTTALIGETRNVVLVASASIENHSIMPKEKHVYEISTQTEGPQLSGKAKDMEEELNRQLVDMREKEQKLNLLQEQLKADKIKYDRKREEERLSVRTELSAEETNQITSSSGFQQFFMRASTMIERALASSAYDFTVDYSSAGGDTSEKDKKLHLVHTFKDKATVGRPVTSLSFSPKFHELFLTTYASQDDPLSFDPDGCVRVWNMHLPSRPEYSFYCNSAVLSACFHPTEPNLIFGACQSGQVVIWDTREKDYPVNRTTLSSGHTHPVYGLTSIPVVNKLSNILSCSTDGHLCVWSEMDLHAPSAEVRLEHGKDEITTTGLGYPSLDTNNIVLASDEGYVYKAHIYDKPGIYEATKAHEAPVSAVRFHPSSNGNLADLYLTSSYDWTVKLWSLKSNTPLYTFESARDYVFDAQWSPSNPSVFAMGDGAGRLDLWNIGRDSDAPMYTTHLEDANQTTRDKAAVSKIQWSDKGDHLAVGTSTGSVALYAVRPEVNQSSDEDASGLFDKLHKKLVSIV